MNARIIWFASLIMGFAYGSQDSKPWVSTDGLGKPAKVEVLENGGKVEYSAEVAVLQVFGQYGWIKEKLPSPRPLLVLRVLRRRGDGEVEQIGRAVMFEKSDIEPPDYKITPWIPSIVVNEGVVWVLFTRNVSEQSGRLRFLFYCVDADSFGFPPKKEKVISEDMQRLKDPGIGKHPPPDIQLKYDGMSMRQIACCDRYLGGLKIKRVDKGEVVMSAPVLLGHPWEPEVEKQELLEYYRNLEAAKARHEKNPKQFALLEDIREKMKDKEIILRYHIEKKKWSIDIPEGYDPP